MRYQRLFAGLLLAAASAFLAGSTAPDLFAGQDDTPKTKAEKKALLKKLLAEKRAKAEQAPKPDADKPKPEKASTPDATVEKPAKPAGKPLDYKALAGLIDREIDKQLAAAKI